MPLALSEEARRRLQPVSFARNRFINKGGMGEETQQAIDTGIIEARVANAKEDQALLARKKEAEIQRQLEERRVMLEKKRFKFEKEQAKDKQLEAWLGPVGKVVGWAK